MIAGESGEVSPEFLKEDLNLHKAIGLITCASVMAASLYLFSGGDPSRTLSAQTEPAKGSGRQSTVARRFLQEARAEAEKGNVTEARRRAETAKSLSSDWSGVEETPDQFLAALDGQAAPKSAQTSLEDDWSDSEAPADSDSNSAAEPIAEEADEEAVSSADMRKRREAQRLVREARVAMKQGDMALARSRAMQARQLKASYALWDDRPEHVLADIDAQMKTATFVADAGKKAQQAVSKKTDAAAARAESMLQSARRAMDAGELEEAEALAAEAESLKVAFAAFEDSPALIRRDIQRLQAAGKSAEETFAADASAAKSEADRARQLLRESRTAAARGDAASAKAKAAAAAEMDVAWNLTDDRPELAAEEAEFVAARSDSSSRVAANGTKTRTPKVNNAGFDETDMSTISPEGRSAGQAYRQGIAMLRSGDRDGARSAFQAAWKNAGELSSTERRQLQEFLQDLASPKAVRLASSQEPAEDTDAPADGDVTPLFPDEPAAGSPGPPDALTSAADKSDVQYDRLRTEVMNSVFRAEKMKTTNPDEALQILDNTLATIEATPLSKESLETLAGYVRRSHASISAWRDQQAPNLAREDKNRNIMEAIQLETEAKIRIEQEFADLVEDFNLKMKERRYAEAELIARKAKDLNPDLPQATIMVEKAKLQKQIAFNEDVKERKADSFLQSLNDVEEAMIAPGRDYNMPDARSWGELTKRRERLGRVDSRERTESELKIEKSLGDKVSLHYKDTPLTEVVRQIALDHGINITMKTREIESEGLSVTQMVSIDVDGITLRSALNLLLDQAGGLVYSIENETLMITNRLEQETKYLNVAYNVADLVVPVGIRNPANVGQYGNSVPGSERAPSASGNGFYQVNDDLAVSIGGNGRPSANGTGSGSNTVSNADFSGLVNLITTTVEPGTWDVDGGQGTIGQEENTLSLVIRQTSAVHEQIADLLTQLRKLQDLQVTVEVRFISVSDNFFERIGVDFDMNLNDTLGDPPGVPAFGSRQLQFPGGAGQNGGGGGGQQGGDLRGNQQGQGGGGQQGQQNQGGGQQLFDPINRVNSPRDDFRGTVVGMSGPNQFTQDYDIQFRQGSFEIGVPDFGGFQPNAGIQVGMAILSDIEAFFFIQAAQGDSRSNILFAPKVTMYNGQFASITDQTQRYLVIGQIPNLAPGAVGFQPIVAPFPDGISLTVSGVVSADRRYVRLSMSPFFSQIIDVQTFTNVNAGGAGGLGGGGGGGFGGGGGGGQGGQQGQQGGGQSGTLQLPVISTISVSTVVSVPDGGTVLLGGIKRLREGRNMAGVPILNKIPYISRLFKNSGVGRETESIMLMVTPRIIIQEEEEEIINGTAAE
ncbi:MAG: hypothetical protein ACK5MM_03060 [Planctomyces sp.]